MARRQGSSPVDAERRSANADPGVALRSPTGSVVIAATTLASTVGFLDASVVNVAVPAIGLSLHASVATLQWTLTSYLVTVAALLLLAGALADRFGRRRMMVVGLLVVAVSSVLCAAAATSGLLVAARVVQGVGGALIIPSSLALLNGSLRAEDRARGIGIWAGLSTLGSTVGPYAGGWLLDHSSWRWLFLLNLPLVLAALLALRLVPESGDHTAGSGVDIPGVLLAALGLGGVVYALTQGAADGWSSPPVVVAGVLGVVALLALGPVERRVRWPMLKTSLFSSSRFTAINVLTALFYATITGAGFLFTVQCEVALGYSAAQAGAVLIPGSVVLLVLSPVSGRLVSRVGPRRLMTAGIVAVAAAVLWLSTATTGTDYATSILPATLVWGLGLGLSITPLTAAVLAAVPAADLGEGSAINNAAARIGGVVAIAALPALAGASGGRSLAETFAHGYQPAMALAAALSIPAAVIAVLFVTDDPCPAPRFAPPPPHGCGPSGSVSDRSDRPVPGRVR